MNDTKAADGAFSRLGISSLEEAVLQHRHVFRKHPYSPPGFANIITSIRTLPAYTLTEAWRLASLWETSSLQASLRKTYMRIVSQESKQLVSPLFTNVPFLNAQMSQGFPEVEGRGGLGSTN